MIFEPQVQAHLDAMGPVDTSRMDPPERRRILRDEIDRIFTLFGEPGPEVERVCDFSVPVEGGEITIRAYRPELEGDLPVHVVLHGGGFTTGSIDELVADASARHRAVGAGCVVVGVEYRLAPEHRFPVPVHDVIAAVRWVRANADRVGVDPSMLTIGGASAGANLAAAAVVGGDLGAAALVLEVPALDLSQAVADLTLDVREEYTPLLEVSRVQLDAAKDEYLGDLRAAASPLASPLLAPDLSAFPETFILTAELDLLRRDGERFAEKLREAGVPVRYTCYPGALHGSPILTGSWATARQWQDDIIEFLRAVHYRRHA